MYRFGRDYYINDAITPSGDKQTKSGGIRSRPTSSLSQHSNTGGDFELQVSFDLEKFEEASLRGSLRRCSYRSPNSSSQFVINPLIHLYEEKPNRTEKVDTMPKADDFTVNFENIETMEAIKNTEDDQEIANRQSILLEHQKSLNKILNLSERKKEFLNQMINFQEDVVTNPIFEIENRNLSTSAINQELNPIDQDSGMYSIESSDSDFTKISQSLEDARNNFRKAKENQLLSIHGKRYWDFGVSKYQTFGGIKTRRISEDKSDNEEQFDKKDLEEFPVNGNDYNFAALKFQTFGGIKKDKIDSQKLDPYRKIKSRKTLSNMKQRNLETETLIDFEFQRRHQNIFRRAKTVVSDQGGTFKRRKSLREKKLKKIAENECFVDEEIMSKFLEDASARPKSRLSTDNESVCSQRGTKRRRPIYQNFLINKNDFETDTLRLEPPLIPEFIERNFETLKDLRSINDQKSRSRKNFQEKDLF